MTRPERRRYFRVDDEVALTLMPLADEYGGETIGDAASDLQEQVHASLEIQLRQSLADLRSTNPDLAHLLDLMNQKINLIHNHDVAEHHTPLLKPVSLSACGIAFTWPETLKVGEKVLLHIFLLPMRHMVKCEAQVVAVENNHEPQSLEPYVVRLDFVDLAAMYQELLIQHVVQRQSVHLRRRSGLDSKQEDDA